MTMIDCAGALQVCAMRVAKLNADGSPAVGANMMYIADTLILLTATPEIAAGDDFEQKNGCGAVGLTYKGDDTLKRLNMDMQLVTPNPELISLLTGGSLFTFGGNNVGHQPRRVGAVQPYSVSVEAWCRAIVSGTQATNKPWFRFVYPKTRWQEAPRTLQNQPIDNVLTGIGEENPAWYDGPAHDWFLIAQQEIDSLYGVARDSSIPTTACGLQTTVAS
jgi:hypothetical protein